MCLTFTFCCFHSFKDLFGFPPIHPPFFSNGDAKVSAFIKSSKTFCCFLKFSFSENSYQYFEELVIFQSGRQRYNEYSNHQNFLHFFRNFRLYFFTRLLSKFRNATNKELIPNLPNIISFSLSADTSVSNRVAKISSCRSPPNLF